MTKVSYRSHQLVASVCLLVAQPGPGMHVDYVLIAIAEDDVPNGRRCLFIQADALLVVQADMEQRCSAQAHANIDVPPAAVSLTYIDGGERAAGRSEERRVGNEGGST